MTRNPILLWDNTRCIPICRMSFAGPALALTQTMSMPCASTWTTSRSSSAQMVSFHVLKTQPLVTLLCAWTRPRIAQSQISSSMMPNRRRLSGTICAIKRLKTVKETFLSPSQRHQTKWPTRLFKAWTWIMDDHVRTQTQEQFWKMAKRNNFCILSKLSRDLMTVGCFQKPKRNPRRKVQLIFATSKYSPWMGPSRTSTRFKLFLVS